MNTDSQTAETIQEPVNKEELQLERRSTWGTKRHYENCRSITRKIAQRLLASKRARLDERAINNLNVIAEKGTYGDITCELRCGEYKVTLYLGPESFACSDASIKDDAGNTWVRRDMKFSVNWSACGTQDISDTLVYADLLRDAASMAAEIKAEFGKEEVYECCTTAAERIERDRKAAAAAFDAKVKSLVLANCKAMRVGQERWVPSAFEPDTASGGSRSFVVEGQYDRTYEGNVTPSGALYFNRTK